MEQEKSFDEWLENKYGIECWLYDSYEIKDLKSCHEWTKQNEQKRIKELESAMKEFIDVESVTDNMPDTHHLMREMSEKFKELLKQQ